MCSGIFFLTTYLHSSKKHLIIFTCCKSRIDQNYRSINKLRTLFSYFVTENICVGFSIIRFYFTFYIFFILFRSTIKFFFDTNYNYFINFIVKLENSNNSTSLIKQYIYLVSSKSVLYALNLEEICIKV